MLIVLVCNITVKAQCPQIYDYLGNLTTQPYWLSCTGGSYNLNFQSNSNWGAFTINWGDGSPNYVGAGYSSGTIINHTYTPQVDTSIVTLIIPSLNCTLTGVVVQEKAVNASIQIPLGGVTQACAPKALQFINSSTDVSPTTHFSWDFGDGSPLSLYSYTNAGQTVTHTYNKGTVNCQTQVTLKAWNYCSQGNTTIATYNPIQIYDLDNAAITPDKYIRCWPDNVFTFTNTTNRNCLPQGNTFQRQEWWNFGNYWGKGHDSIINWKPWPPTTPYSIAYPAIGTYTLMLRDSNLCGVDTSVISISIVPPPTAGILAPTAPLCQNTSITFTNTSSAGYVYLWDFGAGGGFINLGSGVQQSFTYTNSGTYTAQVVAYVPGGGSACSTTAQVIITILPSPTANFVASPTVGCNNLNNANFIDASIGAVAWNWNFANGNTSSVQSPLAQNYTTTGVFNVSLTVTGANTCKNTKILPIKIYPKPIANFTPTSACVGSIIQFTNNSTVTGTNAITNYTWSFGDISANSTATNPAHTYTAAATYSILLIAKTAYCTDSITKTLVANVKPTASFVVTPTVSCPPFIFAPSNNSQNASNYNWNFGVIPLATSSQTNPIYSYTNSSNSLQQNYTISLVAISGAGCSDTLNKIISVNPTPVSNFTGNLAGGCSPLPVTFTNTSLSATSYTWNFGDGAYSNSINTSHTYTNNTLLLQTNTITLIALNSYGCSDSIKKTISVFPKPFFSFTMVPGSGCTPLNVTFPPVLGAVSYTWDFGDSSPLSFTSNPTHVYTNTSTSNYTPTVTLTAYNAFGCLDTTYGYPIIYPASHAGFALTPSVGCSPLAVNFTNTSIGNNLNYWYFGNTLTSTLLNPSTNYINTPGNSATSYSVKLVVATIHNCKDSATQTVNLFALPKAQFNVDTPACSPKNLSFINTSQGGVSYFWNFGNTATSTLTSPNQQYINNSTNNQTYTVTLIATNAQSCKDSITNSIFIHPKPHFFITASPDSGCAPLKTLLTATAGIANYNWSLGDGNTAITTSVINTYINAGTATKIYTIQLIANNAYACYDTVFKTIKVFPKPTSLFQVNPSQVFIPNQSTQCTNLSLGATQFNWSFGDGGVANTFSTTHTYVQAGTYSITLIAISNKGCKDTSYQTITAIPESYVQIPNAFTPNSGGSSGTTYLQGSLSNEIFHPIISGTDKYKLSIYSRWGELLFETQNPNEGWDGYYRGQLCTQDVYVWKIYATFIDGKTFNKTGDVTLIR